MKWSYFLLNMCYCTKNTRKQCIKIVEKTVGLVLYYTHMMAGQQEHKYNDRMNFY